MTWTVTMRTGENTWSVIQVTAVGHMDAIAIARRLVGGTFVSVV